MIYLILRKYLRRLESKKKYIENGKSYVDLLQENLILKQDLEEAKDTIEAMEIVSRFVRAGT